MKLWTKLLLCFLFFYFFSCTENKNKTDTPLKNTTQTKLSDKEQSPKKEKAKTIVFFGTSLTAAMNLDPADGFTNLIQEKINALNLNYKVINSGESGRTSAGGKSNIDWITSRQHIDIFVLELGANDGLRGLDLDVAYDNLQYIIDIVKKKNPKVKIVIVGMEAPPNMGDDFTKKFRAMYPKLAKENKAALIPFLLDGVAANPSLNLPDGIHPNVKGHKILAENVWTVLKELLD